MGWFGNLIGTEKAVDNILDKDKGLLAKTGAWIGNFNYTDEEKAEADQETRQWGFRQLEALAPFKVVQRILAAVVAAMWSIVGLNILVAIWLKEFTDGRIDATADLMSFAFSDFVFWPTCVVFALYFAGGVIPRGADKGK